MRDIDLAYLAGVMDSDGCIRINRSRKTMRSQAGATWQGTYFAAHVSIAGTRRQPHDLAQAIFGGTVRSYEPKNPANRVVFQWTAWGRVAAVYLRAIRPYLLVKCEQADLALELQDLVQRQFEEIKATTRPPYRIPPEMTAERERLFRAITLLNQDRRAASRELDGVVHDGYPA